MLSSVTLLLEHLRQGVSPHLPKAFREGSMTWVFVISVVVILALIPSTMMDMEVCSSRLRARRSRMSR